MRNLQPGHKATTALGRSYGALFFSCFGACWMLLSSYAFGVFRPPQLIAIASVLFLLVLLALRVLKQARNIAVDQSLEPQRKRDDRRFGVVNAVQWTLVFLIFTAFPKLNIGDFAFPAVLLVVGLHFFFMPPSYRHNSNFVTGAVLSIWAVVCPLLFQGDRMIAWIALGAGLTLWASAAWALAFANRLLSQTESHMIVP